MTKEGMRNVVDMSEWRRAERHDKTRQVLCKTNVGPTKRRCKEEEISRLTPPAADLNRLLFYGCYEDRSKPSIIFSARCQAVAATHAACRGRVPNATDHPSKLSRIFQATPPPLRIPEKYLPGNLGLLEFDARRYYLIPATEAQNMQGSGVVGQPT